MASTFTALAEIQRSNFKILLNNQKPIIMNYKAIVIVGLLIIALLSWLVCRNFKDEKDFEKI